MKKLMKKLGMTNQTLMEMDEETFNSIKGLSMFETKQLSLWRQRLIEENRESDIFKLIDNFNLKQFKKTNPPSPKESPLKAHLPNPRKIKGFKK